MIRKKSPEYVKKVMQVHGWVFAATFIIPFICWVGKILNSTKCFSMIGVGMFILTGHTIAYHDSYLQYLKEKDTGGLFDENGLKRFLRFGILIDLSLVLLFYSYGLKG